MLCIIASNLTHAYAHAKNLTHLSDFINRLPLYKPLTANSFLLKTGFVTQEELQENKINLNQASIFNYPKQKLEFDKEKAKPLNVLLIVHDSLRYDMLDEKIMPHSFKFSQNAFVFHNHYSSSNSTRGGIFGLFYGLSPSYWQVALSSGRHAALLDGVYENDYKLGVFTSATLAKPEFYKTIFSKEKNLRMSSSGENGIQRDENAVKDFEKFIANLKENDRFFSFIFLDNIHGYAIPKDFKAPFTPYTKQVNQLALNNESDAKEYFNLYKNATFYADTNVAKILQILEQSHFNDNTLIIITSDHGEEFNDNKQGFWGHNSNFTDAQSKIPLIIKHPHKQGENIHTLSTAYDISTTLMEEVFGVKNESRDYSLGQNLFNLKQRNFVIAGSYLENAIIEKDRIVLIDKLGVLRFKDKNYKESENSKDRENVFEALKMMSEFLK